MLQGDISARDRAYLAGHAGSAVAWALGTLWSVDSVAVRMGDGPDDHRPPVAAAIAPPSPPAPADGDEPNADVPDEGIVGGHVARLVPLRVRSRRALGNTLRGWGLVILVTMLIAGFSWSDDRDFPIIAAGLTLACLILPGMVIVMTAPLDARVLLPLEILRDRVEHDGVHAVELRDVDGTVLPTYMTAHLATALLIASDPDTDPVMVTDSPGSFGLVAVEPGRGQRAPHEIAAAPALVNLTFPAQHYVPEQVEAVLTRASRIADATREDMDIRIARYLEETGIDTEETDVMDLRDELSIPVDTHTLGWGRWGCAWTVCAATATAVAATLVADRIALF